ncbi:unnamed protein product (macronuclear) [Paramecium tetraurelia]|uniref:Uncharacterized protein n=1 Tax=Paramecium tetraurelia TaxID=5888 RepID=A0C6P1_PARTE|nr:uncharacterized protein GSPATT00035587001 [Paramecium tetraurelia]CAK66458.1 unnamed protein product [Paramecium tetraurelia]|eukprot:XP_001433855.1 hypothetical protein (macronuclear) [Paramecium tetraurelia strain d4-2]
MVQGRKNSRMYKTRMIQAYFVQLFQKIQPVEIIRMSDSKKKSQSVLYIYEDESESKFKETIKYGVLEYEQHQYQQALFQFKQAEQILTAIASPPIHYQLINKINIGTHALYQGCLILRHRMVGKCLHLFRRYYFDIEERILLDTIRLQCFLQCCIILSEIGQHHEALAISKIAIKKALKLMFDLHSHSEESLQKKLLEEILRKSIALPQLKPKQQGIIITFPSSKTQQLTQENLLYIFNNCPTQYIEKANILSYIQMTPLNFDSLLLQVNPSNQQFLHILSLFVISLYCTSTESRFIEQILDPLQFTEAENYLSRALELVYLYFPKDMPLVNQLLNVHNRFHDISKQIIQEDVHQKHEQNYEIVLLKPLLEPQKCGFVIPIIRKSKCSYLIKERAISLKEQQFQITKVQNLNIDTNTYEGSKPQNRKLRSISTTNKNKPNSPKWGLNQVAEIYLKEKNVSNHQNINITNFRQTHFKRPQTKASQKQYCFEKPRFNINFLIINNLNHVQLPPKRKRGTSFNLESIKPPQTAQNSAKGNKELLKSYQMQTKIKNLIKSYQI